MASQQRRYQHNLFALEQEKNNQMRKAIQAQAVARAKDEIIARQKQELSRWMDKVRRLQEGGGRDEFMNFSIKETGHGKKTRSAGREKAPKENTNQKGGWFWTYLSQLEVRSHCYTVVEENITFTLQDMVIRLSLIA